MGEIRPSPMTIPLATCVKNPRVILVDSHWWNENKNDSPSKLSPDGTRYAIPWNLENATHIYSKGVNVLSPMLYEYSWPGAKPMPHQIVSANYCSLARNILNTSDMGTGKTLVLIWAMHYLLLKKQIDKVLIFAPDTALNDTWMKELFFTIPSVPAVVLQGSNRDYRIKKFNKGYTINIINHEGFGIIEPLIKKSKERWLFIIDEANVYRNLGGRWKTLIECINHMRENADLRVWPATATPMPKTADNAYCLARMIGTMPYNITTFRGMVMEKPNPRATKWVNKDNAIETVYSYLRPCIRFKKREVLPNLPPVSYKYVECKMSAAQQEAFNTMKRAFFVEYEQGLITAANEAVKIMKLLQICAGFCYGGDDKLVDLHPKSKLDALSAVLDNTTASVLCFVPWTRAIEIITSHLNAKHKDINYEVVYGKIKKKDREESFNRFRRNESRIIVAHFKTMSHSLNLAEANCTFWWNATHHGDNKHQADNRMDRPDQKRNMYVLNTYCNGFERSIYQRIEHEQSTQGVLLDYLQRGGLE